jgi:hypothetical protein
MAVPQPIPSSRKALVDIHHNTATKTTLLDQFMGFGHLFEGQAVGYGMHLGTPVQASTASPQSAAQMIFMAEQVNFIQPTIAKTA